MLSSIRVLYSDSCLLAIAKPPGLVVHEAPGPGPSLLRVLREAHGLEGLTLVHRLDKDASGVLLLGRTKQAASALQARWDEVEKTYLALCEGIPEVSAGLIDAPILEHQTGRPKRMAIALRNFTQRHPGAEVAPLPPPKTSAVHPAGRSAQTAYRVVEEFRGRQPTWSLVELAPRQGRMHQLRVHLAQLGHPLAVDRLYGRRAALTEENLSATANGADGGAVLLARMPLHAARLVFPLAHEAGRRIAVEAPLPDDLAGVLQRLRS